MAAESDTSPVISEDEREKKKRGRQILLVAGLVVFIILSTWIELKFLGVNSHLFLVIFNLNLALLVIILVIVVRNLVRLIVDRRRKVLGSRLRTRLVVAFFSLSIVPTLLMFLVAVKFVHTSVDYWFKSRVEKSMEQALKVGRGFYATAQRGMEHRGRMLAEAWQDLEDPQGPGGNERRRAFLEAKAKEYQLQFLAVGQGEELRWHWSGDVEGMLAWREAKPRVDWNRMRKENKLWSTILTVNQADMAVGVFPVPAARSPGQASEGDPALATEDGSSSKGQYLILVERVGRNLLRRLGEIGEGLDEYRKLETLRSPLTWALTLTLALMALLIVLGAIHFGLRMARELSAPMQALAAGTQQIARGEFGVRLVDNSDDELGHLVKSFNSMAEDIEQGQARLRQANQRLEQQNIELEARGLYMEAVLDNITSGVVSLDADGRISTVNKAAEAMLGLMGNDVIGKSPMELLSGEYADLVGEAMRQLSSGGALQWQRQLELVVRGRDMKFLVNLVVLHDAGGQESGLVAVFEDITEIEKMQRLAAWREVARRIAHEIKNPLTPIKLSAQRLERKFAKVVDDSAFEECTALIVRQVEHLQRMVEEFSAFAKLPEVTPRPDDIRPVIEDVVALFRHGHPQIEWELAFQDKPPLIRFDREAMRRVLINLLTNCAEAFEGRGEGQAAEPGVIGRVQVIFSLDASRGRARIEVRDNGPGFTQEERSRLFEPYFSRKRGGTGLGLTIVKSIISDHHGFVRARANQSGGASMLVDIPIA